MYARPRLGSARCRNAEDGIDCHCGRRNDIYRYPESQTPWQEILRGLVDELSNGMVLKPAVKCQRIVRTHGVPRDNH